MYAMAAQATHCRLGVRRPVEVGVSAGMTAKTGFIYLLGRSHGEVEDLGLVAAGLDVRLAWPMAALTGDAFAAMLESQLGMSVGIKVLGFRCVAGGAGLRTDVFAGIGILPGSRGRGQAETSPQGRNHCQPTPLPHMRTSGFTVCSASLWPNRLAGRLRKTKRKVA